MLFRKILKSLIVLFLSVGVAEAGVPEEVHKGCTTCHMEQDFKAIKTKINETCLRCHPTSIGKDHPVGVVSTIVPEGLPLDEGNKITCITCHEPHGKNTVDKLLRKDFNSLCIACHKNK
jgi:predicted CXXCH cytochrome family protein